MASDIYKIHGVVEEILKKYPETRDDDFLLVAKFYEVMYRDDPLNDVTNKSFMHVMRNHTRYHLPAFESITRARRKLQATNTELRSAEEVEQIRMEQQAKFLEYAHDVS